jgi:ribA/ribD-fused uncharacterized protein
MIEKFTFFYGGVFSNWYPVKFVVDGVTYNCSEQYMMAEKARLFNDQETLKKIMEADHPRDQKRLGRQVKNFNIDKWNAVAKDIVYKGCQAKFTQDELCYREILETQGTTLVEASPTDSIWGIGLSETNIDVLDRSKWKGENWLGEVLTNLREDLIKEIKSII